jgi:hypothetical protein
MAFARIALASIAGALAVHVATGYSGGAPGDDGIALTRFLANHDRPLVSYLAFRDLEATTRGGRMRARLRACTWLEAAGTFRYTVVAEEGSSIIRNKVLKAALDAERKLRADGDLPKGALTRANYDFMPANREGELLRIGLEPKRPDTLLVAGSMLLNADDGDLVRVEGRLSKRPSFWTRHVDVRRLYARMDGVRVPVRMESTASVLFVGASTFSMRYEYVTINGTAVAASPSGQLCTGASATTTASGP